MVPLDDEEEFSVTLNGEDLSYDTGCGTFELYTTKNIYQFLLLDKVTGRRWHVQWEFPDFVTFLRSTRNYPIISCDYFYSGGTMRNE